MGWEGRGEGHASWDLLRDRGGRDLGYVLCDVLACATTCTSAWEGDEGGEEKDEMGWARCDWKFPRRVRGE